MTTKDILTRARGKVLAGLAAVAMLGVYCLSTLAISGLALTASTTSAAAQGVSFCIPGVGGIGCRGRGRGRGRGDRGRGRGPGDARGGRGRGRGDRDRQRRRPRG